ncbi:MAG: hypothetical protein H6797_01615 [Candidatus Nomurabacteria bacterium]|nr:MAG: hypothetical protein H6797_01615 [Candidatus Nomurabacteria bacterium]
MQKKAVIYIDVEDDITAIIGKVKDAKEKIVALVPPKRTGMLQSAVNLRLLARTADNAGKRLVLITSSSALASLAASAKIPVAKTLQSPPRLADAQDSSSSKSDSDDDVIDGGDLPVGDHAGIKDEEEEEIIVPEDLESLDMNSDVKPKKADVDDKKKSRVKVPDFGMFRKKMAFGAVGGVLLIAFLVWANVVAPHATVIVSAKTSAVDIKTTLSIGDSLSNDATKNTLSSITQTDKQTQSVSFDATGKKDVGTKASGTVVFENCQSANDVTVNSGTYLSVNGLNYIAQSTVVVPGGKDTNSDFKCDTPGESAPVNVVAEDVGDTYNTTAGTTFAVAGYDSTMSATSTDGIAGGEKHQATVVSASDVQSALEQLKQQNTDDEKKKLQAKFSNDIVLIDDSLSTVDGTPKLTPGIGEEVKSGQAKLTADITYSLMGVSKSSLESYLSTAIGQQLNGDKSKRIYDTGVSTVKFSNFQAASGKKPATIDMTGTGQVGLKIDDGEIKSQVGGKLSGEAIDSLKKIDGVNDVSVNLSPFWVQSIPNDPNKITIQFRLIKNG